MSPAKGPKKGPKKSGAKRSGGGGRGSARFFKRVGLVALILLVAGITAYLAYDYHAVIIRDEVRSLVGELDETDVRVRVAAPREGEKLMDALRALSRRSLGSLRVEAERRVPGGVEAELVLSEGRYTLTAYWEEEERPPREGEAALLAVVIDDLGRSETEAREFLDLPFAVTPAILPYLDESAGVAREATRRRRPFLLHMPMEPRDYPERNPGEGALMAGMNEAEVRRALGEALDRAPGAAGVNNHMGSRATADPKVMTWVADELARRDLLFLDSRTAPDSAAKGAVARAGGRWATRDVFLDNEKDAAAIRARLDEAVGKARKSGHAVAIGHPYPETLTALRAYAPEFERRGVRVVPVTRIAERLGP